MNRLDLINAFRREVKDTHRPYLVADEDAIRYADQAQVEAARRARLLVDSSSDLCEVDVVAGESVVDTDPRIISIRRARLQSAAAPLHMRQVRQMDEQFTGWDSSTSQSTPFVVVTDYGTNQLYLYPTPKADTTLKLTVTREPLRGMESDKSSPEIAPRYHEGLILWMKYRVFNNEDSDLYDAAAAEKALSAFTAEFGFPTSATDEQFEFENYHDVGER